MNKDKLSDLLDKYLTGSLTEWERSELSGLLEEPDYHAELEKTLSEEFASHRFEGDGHHEILAMIESNVLANISKRPKRIFYMHRWAVAAAVVMVLFSAGYFLLTQKTAKQLPTANRQLPTDILPGSNKAVLTLGNGSTIILDSAANGKLAQQGNTNIIKTDSGRLAYNASTEKQTKVLFNTLSTPRGGKFQITLPDGSNVWLNAASSITYPTSFIGKERKVTITGEAYFEVIHDAKQPFIAEVNGTEVKDLGTHFNINAYSDESAMKITLIQGAVRVTSNAVSKNLMPKEQAFIANGNVTVAKNVDTEKVIAWKNGWFELENTSLVQLMRQVSRWYDIDIKYEGAFLPTTEFGGRISNKLPLSKLLESLETNGNGIKFRMEGKTLIIHN